MFAEMWLSGAVPTAAITMELVTRYLAIDFGQDQIPRAITNAASGCFRDSPARSASAISVVTDRVHGCLRRSPTSGRRRLPMAVRAFLHLVFYGRSRRAVFLRRIGVSELAGWRRLLPTDGTENSHRSSVVECPGQCQTLTAILDLVYCAPQRRYLWRTSPAPDEGCRKRDATGFD